VLVASVLPNNLKESKDMPAQLEIHNTLSELQQLAPAGFALAFHIRYTTPTFLFQTYAKDWLDYYSQNGLVMSDPTVAWGFENTGVARWSDLAAQDTAGVMSKAAEYGMPYGAVFAIEVAESRSLGSFARSDREFTESEIERMQAAVAKLHDLTADLERLSPETSAKLRTMSVQFTHSQ